jgi:hypothetical protein
MSLSQEDIPWIKQTCEKIGVEVKTVENLRSIFQKYGMKKVSELLFCSLLLLNLALCFFMLPGVNFP